MTKQSMTAQSNQEALMLMEHDHALFDWYYRHREIHKNVTNALFFDNLGKTRRKAKKSCGLNSPKQKKTSNKSHCTLETFTVKWEYF